MGHGSLQPLTHCVMDEMHIGPVHASFLSLSLRFFPASSEAQACGKTRSFRPKISAMYLQLYVTFIMTSSFLERCNWESVFELFKQPR